jgi:hypothetical protein
MAGGDYRASPRRGVADLARRLCPTERRSGVAFSRSKSAVPAVSAGVSRAGI